MTPARAPILRYQGPRLHRVGGGGGEPGRGRGTGGRGEDGQGGGQRAGTAACGRRIVGVHLDQPGDLRVRIAHQREGQDLAPDSRRGQQQVVVAGQVRSLVRQDGADLLGIQRLQRGGGQDHRRVRPADAVGGWLRMVDQRGAQVRVRAPDQAGGLRVLHRLPPDRAQVRRRGERGAGQHRTGQGEPEPGRGGAARRGVGVPQPQHAGADQMAQPAAQGGGMDRQGQAGQSERGQHRPGGGQVDDDPQQRRPDRPAGPAEQPRARRADASRVHQQDGRYRHRVPPSCSRACA
jgi:hypothetical protein